MNDADKSTGWISGKLLVAMPSLNDKRFHKSVIFICAHDEKGAMGIIINRAIKNLAMSTLLEDLLVPVINKEETDKSTIYIGGPVETRRGFLLHSSDFFSKDTITVDKDYAVTGTIEALKDVLGNNETGPKKHLFALGYAGWDSGQLEEEIKENSWLICDADSSLIFSTDDNKKWALALQHMGIDPALLSATQGMA